MKKRWPKSLHSQIEAVFHSIRSFRKTKHDNAFGLRSFGSWTIYKIAAHKFADYLQANDLHSLLDFESIQKAMDDYLQDKLNYYESKRRSRQTMETLLASMGKLSYAINEYCKIHDLKIGQLDTDDLRMGYYSKSKKLLHKSSKVFDNRAYLDPLKLIANLPNRVFQLQACLQFEGGLRTEGVGAPSNRKVKNPLTSDGLIGIGIDPVTGSEVGIIASIEKGGKKTEHFVSTETYRRVEGYIRDNGKLESDYLHYVKALNIAAKATGQHSPGRGSHGLKHSFAQERYQECIAHGLSHEKALQQTSLETSHFRMSETLTYTRG